MKSGKLSENTMNEIKQIRTKEDYEAALKLIEILVANDPHPDSDDGEKLSLLATLVGDYESKAFPETLPHPVEAIKFRMEQSNLKPADLIPYIGSRSRVSEILSGKRKLTIEMMRALEVGLGIPARVLLKEPQENEDTMFSNWSNGLLKEMSNRGYFGKRALTATNGQELVEQLFSVVGSPLQLQGMLRQSSYRSAPTTDRRALAAWAARIVEKAGKVKTPVKYRNGVVNLSFMQKVAKLSIEDDGPLLVQKVLKEHGIILVIEPCFPKTRLDGAVLLMNKDNPIIGLTLRHDRLDNLWFTLMHELAHIALHYNQDVSLFYDELEDVKGIDIGAKEKEADNLAGEALVPASKWEVSPARLIPSFMAADSLAKELGVHVAIVAGKIRYEGGKYVYLNNIVGHAKVQHYFPDEKWNGK
jgi:HTH-type transcriptional regulator / antitoxin HigA